MNKTIFEQWVSGGNPEKPAPHLAQMMQFSRTEFTPNRTVLEFEASPPLYNPLGTLHGGVLCYIADTAMGTAWASDLSEGETFSTIELKMNFFRPVWTGTLTADAKVIRRGKNIGYVECEVTDHEGRLVAKASSSCITLRGESAQGR